MPTPPALPLPNELRRAGVLSPLRQSPRLNAIAAVFEHDVDANGNTHTKTWEWK